MSEIPKSRRLAHNQEVLTRFIQDYFYFSQIAIGALFLVGGWYTLRGRSPESNFRLREADRLRTGTGTSASLRSGDLAKAKLGPAGSTEPGEARGEPLRLTGFTPDGEPHRVLGVRAEAGREEIQRAYRELMKRYHPDRVGRPGSREWQDAQRIAEAINQAKETLLKRAR